MSTRQTVRASLILISLVYLVSPAACAVLIAGDVDKSGDVDAVDVQLVINGALELPVAQLTDVDYDLQTNVADIQLVINAVLGIRIDDDNDGLCNAAENNLDTNPDVKDTDGDGLTDGEEVIEYETDPLDTDTDDGGVTDGQEALNGTDPLDPDDDEVADITSNLVAYWDFEDVPPTVGATVVDRSGNGHHGTCFEDQGITEKAPTIVAGPPGLGEALDFDGAFNVEVPHDEVFNISDNITVSAWISVDRWIPGDYPGYTYDAIITHGDWSWRLQRGPEWTGTGDVCGFHMSGLDLAGGGETWGVDGVTNVREPKRWVHLAGTYKNGEGAKFYVDGVLDATADIVGEIARDRSPIRIGAWQEYVGPGHPCEYWTCFGRFFDGQIDEVRVYNRALSDEDVQALYLFKSGGGGEGEDVYYQDPGIIQSNEYPPFTKKHLVYGITLVGRDEISDSFMLNVAETIKEMFSRGGSIDAELEKTVLENQDRYKTVIPFFPDDSIQFTQQEHREFDRLTDTHSVVDVIFENEPGTGQVNEVVEHILHFVSDIGLHHTFPDKWGISETSDVYDAMQEAIVKGHYDISDYNPNDLQVLIQEFAYWVIFTAWDLFEPYGPDAEWTGVNNPTDLQNKLPLAWQLFQETIPLVMEAPGSSLDAFMVPW